MAIFKAGVTFSKALSILNIHLFHFGVYVEKIHEPFGLKGGIEPMVYPASHVSIKKHLFCGEFPTPNCLSKMFGIPNSPNF